MKKKLGILLYLFLFGQLISAQSVDTLNKDLYIVDTIVINDPIMIRFFEKKDSNINRNVLQFLLVSKETLDTSFKTPDDSYIAFLNSRNCYLFFPAYRFSCLFNNFLYKSPDLKKLPFNKKLQKDLRNAEKDVVWVGFHKKQDRPKKYNGWEYNEIYPRRFLLCLVKGNALRKCQSIDDIIIKDMDNVYFKVLVPITW